MKASGCVLYTGEEVGREKASWVELKTWPVLERWGGESKEKREESQPMAVGVRVEQQLVV